MSHPEPEILCREIADDEIDLVDLFLILWKRKWMILVVTLLVTVSAAGISMVLPKVYEITAILVPGKDAEEKLIENPQAIRENILGGAYNQIIAKKLNLLPSDVPNFKVSVPKSTDLVKVAVETSRPEFGVQILNALLAEISAHLQDRLEVKVEEAKNQVKVVELKGQALTEQIKLLGRQLEQTEKKIAELESDRRQAIASPGDGAMAVLLYANEIQNQQIYLNNLQMKKADFESKVSENKLFLANEKLSLLAIKGTNINKQPSAPEKPIKPKKTLIVALSFVLGMMGGVMLAFFAEFMAKVRREQKALE